MSVIGVFSKGRPTGHPAATSILRYIPRARVPWQPSRFARANLAEDDLSRLWGRGRYRDGPGNYNSGYSTERTHTLEDNTISIIPKHELEKYMPNISLDSKALVTPVSLMSARNGHRVTHDMIHSYDPHIGRLQKPAAVDHENISVADPNRVGLNAATLDCRGRIYRWLRRGPFFQEDQYFRRSTQLQRDGSLPSLPQEAPLARTVIRLARRGHLKAACEAYRRFTSVPPVAVYRALTAACVPGGKLADAVAVFEDGNARLFYVARDGEVLYNLMRCAIRARHRVRVVWVYNTMRGRHYENVLVRSEIGVIWRYRIAALACTFLLDYGAAEEAAAIYRYLADEHLLDCDINIRVGTLMQAALREGKTIELNASVTSGVALARNAVALAPLVATALYERGGENMADTKVSAWCGSGMLTDPTTTAAAPEAAVRWLQMACPDVDVLFVLRLARFTHNHRDLMATDQAAYAQRAAGWIELLSAAHQRREEAPLTYMRKSRPSLTNPAVRVGWLPEHRRTSALLAHEDGFCFHHGAGQRLVEETFAYAGDTLRGRYLAQRPIHREISAAADFLEAPNSGSAAPPPPPRVLHSSVLGELHGAQSASGGLPPSARATMSLASPPGSSSGGSTPEF